MHTNRVRGLLLLAVLTVASCGGGGGAADSGSTGTAPPPPASGSVSGTAVKGPVAGASVTAYAINNGAMGAAIASGTTDAQGNFRLPMASYSGPVMLQMTGGSYTDEAGGVSMSMQAGDVMSAVVPAMTAGATVSGIQLTPLTSMAQAMAQHLAGGMSDANIATANSAVGSYFMVNDILHTVPMNPLVAGSGNAATQDSINYGMALAAMSQLARNQGMDFSSAMVTAMSSDASDGIMDGMMSGSAVMMGGMGSDPMMPVAAGTTGLAGAMSAFVLSAQNHSGVATATVQQLIDRLAGSNGRMLGGETGSPVNGTISGNVFDGSMAQAMVAAYAINGGVRGAQVASSPAGANGEFSLSMGSYSGPVMLQVSGGTFADLATGQAMTMGSSGTMSALLPAFGSGANESGVRVTPLSSMAQARAQAMAGGMVDANIRAANSAVGTYFEVGDVLHASPMDPSVPGSGDAASQAARNCGMVIAAMSQYAKEQGMASSFAFVTAMMGDASDGTMNGMMGGQRISMGGGMMGSGGMMMQSNAGTSGLATAMTDFMGTATNRSGLTAADMNVLIQKLAASDGKL